MEGDAGDILEGQRKETSDSFDEIFTSMLPRLRSLAHLYLRRAQPDATLRTTALVNELYVVLRKKLDSNAIDHRDVSRITAALTKGMLYILCDEFDKKSAQKRGGDKIRVPVEDGDVVDVEFMRSRPLFDAQRELQKHYPRTHNIFFLYYEFGYTLEEISALLGISTATVHREVKFATRFLRDHIGDDRAFLTKRFVGHLREQAQ
jgi:RNA polymerase sigma factor (TIGR02999 family)